MLVNVNTATDLTDYSNIEIRFAKLELEEMILTLNKELANRGAPVDLHILEGGLMLLAVALMLLMFAPKGTIVGLFMIAAGLGLLILMSAHDIKAARPRRRLAGSGSGTGRG